MLIKSLQSIGATAAILLATTVSSASPLGSESAIQMSLEFPPAPNRQGAQSSAGGGTRSGQVEVATACSQGETPLTALTPKDTDIQKTISPRPDFYLFVPPTSAETFEFILTDATGGDVYVNTLELPKTSGILQISLPESVTLEEGQTYDWQVVMSCDPNDASNIESVKGQIERIALSEDLKTQIEATDEPLKQAELYAQQYLWQDTLMLMVELRESNPAEWEQLLQSVGLEAIAKARFTNATVPMIPN
jgi:hypothetical protein